MTKNEIKEAGFKSAMWFVERQIDEAWQTWHNAPDADSMFTAWEERKTLERQWHTLKDFRDQAADACIRDTLEALANG